MNKKGLIVLLLLFSFQQMLVNCLAPYILRNSVYSIEKKENWKKKNYLKKLKYEAFHNFFSFFILNDCWKFNHYKYKMCCVGIIKQKKYVNNTGIILMAIN